MAVEGYLQREDQARWEAQMKAKFGQQKDCTAARLPKYVAVGQNEWDHFEVGAPTILVNFSGDGDVHWGHNILTYGYVLIVLNS